MYSYPPVVRTPTGMAKAGIPSRYFYCPLQPNPMSETGRNSPIHVRDRVYSYRKVCHSGTDSKGKCGYMGDRSARGNLEGSGGGDRYPDLKH